MAKRRRRYKRKTKKKKNPLKQSEEKQLEDSFHTYWLQLGDDTVIERQVNCGFFKHYNKKGKRINTRHSFDFAFPALKIAIEIQGGIFGRGRHVRPIGYHEDRAKMRKAMALGWLVLEYTTKDVNEDPMSMIQEVNQFLKLRRKELEKRQPIQLTLFGERAVS